MIGNNFTKTSYEKKKIKFKLATLLVKLYKLPADVPALTLFL